MSQKIAPSSIFLMMKNICPTVSRQEEVAGYHKSVSRCELYMYIYGVVWRYSIDLIDHFLIKYSTFVAVSVKSCISEDVPNCVIPIVESI